MKTFIIASANMQKLKDALGYRPRFYDGNNWDVKVNLTESEVSAIDKALSNDRHFKMKEYNINLFCC